MSNANQTRAGISMTRPTALTNQGWRDLSWPEKSIEGFGHGRVGDLAQPAQPPSSRHLLLINKSTLLREQHS